MLLIRTYFCPVVVNQDFFLQNHMVLSLTLLIIHIFATIAVGDQYFGCQLFAHWEREATITTKGDTVWQQACSTEDCSLTGRKLQMMCKSSFKNSFLTLTGLLPPLLYPSPPPQAPQLVQKPPVAQDNALPATPPAASDSDHSEYEPSRPMIRKRGHPSPSTVRSKKKKSPLQDYDSTPNSDKDPNKEESSGDDRSFQQGMRVLIFYDNQYFVGEVLHTLPEDSDRTSTAFMEQVPKQNIFRWGKEDFDTV